MSDTTSTVLDGLPEALKKAAEAVRAADDLINAVGGLIPTDSRSIVVEINNLTKHTLSHVTGNFAHGGFGPTLPQGLIGPMKSDVFSVSSNGIATGVEGSRTYLSDGVDGLLMGFDDPFFGNNSANVTVSPALSSELNLVAAISTGNRAHARYVLFPKDLKDLPSQFQLGPRRSGSFIQSNFGSLGNFEVVVLEGRNLVHHFIDTSDFSKGWQRGAVISDQATGRGSIIQSNFGPKGNFEVLVLEGRNLVHHFIDTNDFSKGWQRGGVISDLATGAGGLIQSNFGPKGNFEVAVLEDRNLVHHFIDTSDFSKGWQRGGVISDQATGPGSIMQSNFGPKGNFEVVVLEGRNLVHHFLDTSDLSKGWQRGGVISDQATGPGSIIQSNFGPKGNFEVAVQEGGNIVHHFLDTNDFSKGWQRGAVISDQATGPGSLIQSNFGAKGNFEVAVLEGRNLVHHFIDTNDFSKGWQRGAVISDQATG